MVPALAVRDLHKSFGGVDVLRGITYEIDSGQLAVLAGENGAGKSTLMKIVTGQLHPDRGEVHV
ncbi:ATP-binding cassette domain-containing protein, partial [Mycobacteroides abscessus]|uniref:ATP-binding cassette domain-containing protein n=1 Tax=Mycobacteroides abscessus TaxID=36809 RepID=UPI003CF22223